MPKFYFHIQPGAEDVADDEGVELSDLMAARSHARQAIADIIRDELADGQDFVEVAICVNNAVGGEVAKISATLTVS